MSVMNMFPVRYESRPSVVINSWHRSRQGSIQQTSMPYTNTNDELFTYAERVKSKVVVITGASKLTASIASGPKSG